MSNELTGDLGKAFDRFKGEWFYTYRGVTFDKVNGGFQLGDTICRSIEEMDSLINQMEQQLAKSIKK